MSRAEAPASGVDIVDVATFGADAGYRTTHYVRVTTDAGVVGWAEFYAGGMIALPPLIEQYGRKLIEHRIDPMAPGAVSTILNATTKSAPGGLHQNAIAALENACLDIQAKVLGVPVSRLFGGPFRAELPLYWTHCGSYRVKFADALTEPLGKPRIRTIDDLRDVAAEARAEGFTAVKTNPITFRGSGRTSKNATGTPSMFNGGFTIAPRLLERQLTRSSVAELRDQLIAMREGLGDDVDLMLDVAFSQKPEGYLHLARALEDLCLRWFEFDSLDVDTVGTVRDRGHVAVASGEALYGLSGYRPLFERRAVDVVLVDVMWNGFWQSHRVATLADAYQINISPHCPVGDLGFLMSAQLAAAVPNFDILEYRFDEAPWTAKYLTHPPQVRNGLLHLGAQPGWGSDIDEDEVRAHPPRLG